MKKTYIVTDLGPGDGGKGGVVHTICRKMHAHTVVKDGGAQGSHGVRTSGGQAYAFSQWGCGTLEGVRTHLSPRFVITPEGILNEAETLRYGVGVHDPFALLTVDERCLCATPLHAIASHLKELARRDKPRGTIGTGVGEAYRDSIRLPELALFASDLSRDDLDERLAAVREQMIRDLAPIAESPFLPQDRELAAQEWNLLRNDALLTYIVERFRQVARLATIVDHDYFVGKILARDGVIVVERSHGILTDRYTGFHPHTSAIRTLPCFARALLEGAGYDGKIVSLAVHRAYTIRHGAGPMPTDSPSMKQHLLPGSHKVDNRWQGEVRVGPLDLPLLRYAIEASGGASVYDGLALTWFDQIVRNGEWKLCDRYHTGSEDPAYFTPDGGLRVRTGEDEEQLCYLEELGSQVTRCIPQIDSIGIPPDASQDQLFGLVAATLNERLKVPVRMISLGPTEEDKYLK
ncbi:MAG: adenylosuccinate synthetase [Candidatus Uhrbacteria bacterium]|nr:adenylosuccinate synthetase [Candidatus Uhrbacteria bacterium]